MIFLINLPLAIALAAAATRIVPADAKRPNWKGMDARGAALATASGRPTARTRPAAFTGWSRIGSGATVSG